MYLHAPQSFGALPMPVWQVLCPNDSVKARQVVYGNGLTRDADLYSLCGGRTGGIKPSMPSAKPKFMPSYGLTGSYVYGTCKTGYVKGATFRPAPNEYACFDPKEIAWNKANGIVS